MAIVTITKTKLRKIDNQYRDRAYMQSWAFGTWANYGWTLRDVSGWHPKNFSDSRVTSQPTNWNYRHRIRNHLNATTNLTGTSYRLLMPGGGNFLSIRYEGKLTSTGNPWTPMWWEIRGMIPNLRNDPPDPSSIPLADADRDAKVKFLKQVRKNYEAFQGLTFLGELAETVRMLRHPLSALGRGFSDYLRTVKKRANRSSIPRLNNMIAGTWLEYVFGWTPLINDIQNAQEMLDERLNRYADSYERVEGRGEQIPSKGAWSYWNIQNLIWTIYHKERSYTEAFVRYYGQAYRAALISGEWSATRAHLGVSLSAFVPTLWELLPYSFVADYFTNTGELIEAATTNTSGVKWVSRDYIRVGTRETAYDGYSHNQNTSTIRNIRVIPPSSNIRIERRYVQRSWLSEPPTVGLSDFQWKIPGVGSTKWLNLSALAAQQKSTQSFLQKLVRR